MNNSASRRSRDVMRARLGSAKREAYEQAMRGTEAWSRQMRARYERFVLWRLVTDVGRARAKREQRKS